MSGRTSAAPSLGGRRRVCSASSFAAIWYSSMANGVAGRVGIREGSGGEPGVVRRQELRTEPADVEVGDLGLPTQVRIGPGDERRDVHLRLRPGQAVGAGRQDPHPVGATRRRCLLAVPAGRLVAAPGRGEGRDHEQHGDQELLPAPAVIVAPQLGSPCASHGGSTSRSTDVELGVDDAQRPLHRRRLQSTHAVAVRMVEEHEEQQEQRDHDRDASHEHGLGHAALGGICEEQHVAKTTPEIANRASHNGKG